MNHDNSDDSKNNFRYVGLKNMGATCYLNCVIQFLFHIPYFRNCVYHVKCMEDENNSIIYQLQNLFFQLQSSTENSLETKDLIKSFGTDHSYFFQQQDINEFFNWFLDKLSPYLKNEINELFQGKLRKIISNSKGGDLRIVDEEFYDISLDVENFSSLEKSLLFYIKDNQEIECDSSNTIIIKNAFLTLPKIMKIHLKRFSFGKNETKTPCKVNSYFTFPMELDMNKYMYSRNENNQFNIYELFGVIVHNGTSFSGHYYAFFRTTEKNQWYKFNDSLVVKASEKDAIYDNFGGQSENIMNRFNSVKLYSAYMLIYIKRSEIQNIFVDPANNNAPSFYTKFKNKTNEIIDLSIITEKAFILNAQKCIFNLNKSNVINISLSCSYSIGYLFKTISNYINDSNDQNKTLSKFNKIWIIDSKFNFVKPILIKSSDKKKSLSEIITTLQKSYNFNIKIHHFFLDTNLKEGILLFIFFYYKTRQYPFKFLFSHTIENQKSLFSLIPIICQSIGYSNSNKNSEIPSRNFVNQIFLAYEYINDNLVQIPDITEYISFRNGSIFIFQYKDDRDITIPSQNIILETDSKEKYLLEYISIAPFKKADRYYHLFSKLATFKFYSNFKIMPLYYLKCPRRLTIEYIKKFISKLININTKDFLLFGNHSNDPIENDQYPSIGLLHDEMLKLNDSPSLFISNCINQEKITPIRVVISLDSIHPIYYERFFITSEKKYIHIMKKIQFDFNLKENDFRVLIIHNNDIIYISNINDSIFIKNYKYNEFWIRFELIPEDQKINFNPKTKKKYKLIQCRFKGVNLNILEKLPFLLLINSREMIKDIKHFLKVPSKSRYYIQTSKGEKQELNEKDNIFTLAFNIDCFIIEFL